MKKRMFLMVIAALVFIAAIAAVKTRQIQAGMKAHAAFQMPPEAVTTVVAKSEQWPATWNAIGSVTAVQGVTVSADLPGIVETISFESGQMVPAGAVLVRLDTKQEEAQLAAAEAGKELSNLNLKRAKGLVEQGIQAQSDLDRLDAEYKQAEAKIGEIRATIQRKTIRAPFAGVLGIRQVNLGQYLDGGAPVVPLQSIRPVYVNFAVPQQEVAQLKIGFPIHVTAEGAGVASDGKITAFDSVINESTRNVQVQATMDNKDGTLRPGMFVKTNVGMGTADAAVTIPASAVAYAPYGDSVFVVEQVKDPKGGKSYLGVRQQFVKIGASRGDQVAVTSGVKPGETVVTSGVFKLRNGAAVQVNNQATPGNNPAPKPEDS